MGQEHGKMGRAIRPGYMSDPKKREKRKHPRLVLNGLRKVGQGFLMGEF